MAVTDPASPRRRGRPRSVASHEAVLRAATELLDERGLDGFTVDEVARRSGVSKATIYKHWSSGLGIAVEAYGTAVTAAIPVPSSGDAIVDLTEQVRQVAALYAGPRGRVIAQLLAAGSGADSGLLRERFFAGRRELTTRLIREGMDRGQLRDDVDPGLVLDLLFGPIVFRLVNGIGPMDADDSVALADLALQGIAASGASESSGSKASSATA